MATLEPKAAISCVACRTLKRKCSKDIPSCSLCARVGRPCQYPASSSAGVDSLSAHAQSSTPAILTSASASDELSSNGQSGSSSDALSNTWPSDVSSLSIQSSHSSLDRAGNAPWQISDGPGFPACWFLDSIMWRGLQCPIQQTIRWIDIEGVKEPFSVAEGQKISEAYFQTTHTWLPTVCLVRITRFLRSATAVDDAHDVVLFVAMHLLSRQPESSHDNSQDQTYQTLKAALNVCEKHGQYTTNFLAAQVLTTTYEVANAIYPAAYISVGSLHRVAYAMGLHNKRFATQLGARIETWSEIEERRRLWWTTLILDRYINVGFMFRPLAHPTIDPNEIVPAQDEAWDRGVLTPNPLLVMSIEARTVVAPFARLCQAAHLLGRVCQHIDEHLDASFAEMHLQDAYSIQRAAIALLSLLQEEMANLPADRRHRLFGAWALCCSALVVLYNLHCSMDGDYLPSGDFNKTRNKGMRIEMQELAIEGFKEWSTIVVNFASQVRVAASEHGLVESSPFVLHALYRAGTTFAWYVRENGDAGHLASLNQVRQALGALRPKWDVARWYLELLKDTESNYRGGGCAI